MSDVITNEIIREYMETVSEEIVQTMVRTAISPVFNEAHDCSAGVFFFDGEKVSIIARADAIPIHIYACLASVEASIQHFRGNLYEGDVLLVSDPYCGGSHIPDYTMMVPVFHQGKPIFFPSVRGHMLDVGGPMPGTMNPKAREIWQEGFRFLPLKLYEKGELRRDVWDLLAANSRLPFHMEHDLNAMIGGCRVGADRILRLVEKYGYRTVFDGVQYIMDYSEKRFLAELKSWPKGKFRGSSALDHDWTGNYDINIECEVTVGEDNIHFDFTGTHEQSPGIINSVEANTMSYIFMVLSAVCPDIPVNSGFFRPVTVHLPEGSVVNPHFPAACGYSTLAIGCDIGEAVTDAFSHILPERVGTTSFDLTLLRSWGVDPRYDNSFYISVDYHNSSAGAGGAYGVDGWGSWSPLFAALKLQSIEVTEIQYPLLYLQSEYFTDSPAPGQWRGAPGSHMVRHPYGIGKFPQTNTIWIQKGPEHALKGYAGGMPGRGNLAVVNPGTTKENVVIENFVGPLNEKDRVFFQSGGGGGWGNPLDRDPERVLEDVLDQLVSIEGAARDYGVVIDPKTKTVDAAATESRRAHMRHGEAWRDNANAVA